VSLSHSDSDYDVTYKYIWQIQLQWVKIGILPISRYISETVQDRDIINMKG